MIITISRMFGSGGSDVAARIAKELGWTLLDNAVVDAVAERLGLPRAEVSSRDERVPSLVERIASTLTMSAPESAPAVADAQLTDTTEHRILDVTRHVIEDAVQKGDAVLVGRGAQAMLAQRTDALHVFCYAAKPALIAYAIAHRGVDPAKVEQEVDAKNRQREQYIKRHWGRDWKSFENYHVCVD